MYYVYMLRCMDDSVYTGITTNIDRRMEEHFQKNEKCAKYTLRHSAKKLESVWETQDRKLASKLEYMIKKKLSKSEKEELINKDNLKELLKDDIDVDQYIRVKNRNN